MLENTKENDKIIKQKLEYIGIDLEDIPQSLLSVEKIKYKPLKTYEDNNYKVYRYVNVKDIDILITPSDRLDDLNEKLKNAMPLEYYLDKKDGENSKQYLSFIEMLNNLDIEKLEEIENEQDTFNDKMPYKVKYRNNYIWQIYYSDIDDKYFMLFSSNETHSEALFYLIKHKLENSEKKIYVPISHLEYSNKILKKSEISDLENYLWFFTKEWPNIYEVHNKNEELTIQILGKTKVYDDFKSLYKISLDSKENAQEVFKLIKALFILQSNEEMEYDFKTVINQEGSIDFCYNSKKITYDNLSEFIRQEVENKQNIADEIFKENIVIVDELEKLRETVNTQKEEYLNKEKQIANFLECRKTFLGRVRFYFKKGKKIKKQDKKYEIKQENIEADIKQIEKIEKKDIYTIEDLLRVCDNLKQEQIKYKNMQMDIKALENKKENLEKKIKNATLYIDEIESHTKSLFDFWKFTNKDNTNLLIQGEEAENQREHKLQKTFNYEEDIEDFGKHVDIKQRELFTKNECDAVFAIRNDLNTFNILNKERKLKKDEKEIENTIKKLKQEYMDNIDIIKEKAFDIFGNVSQDKTKIKTLKNNKHREIEKDKYKILNVNPDVTPEEYKENIENYNNILQEAYKKMLSPYDISLYMVSDEELRTHSYNIFELNIKNEIANNSKKDKLNLYRINLKKNMPAIFYSNIMFYDNLNKTLPEGMDVETKVLVHLSEFDLKLLSKKEFNVNTLNNELESRIQLFEVYEYDLDINEVKK